VGRGFVIRSAAIVLLLAGCGTTTTTSPKSFTPTTVSQDVKLVPAVHQQCADLGALVQSYMLTGGTNGNPQLDQSYATARAEILRQPEAARAGLARADADDVIQACDKTYSDQENAAAAQRANDQARAQAEADAAARAQAEQRANDASNALFRAGCRDHGGTATTNAPDDSGYDAGGPDPAGEYCSVTYNGTTYGVPFTESHTFSASSAAENKDLCAANTVSAQDAAVSASAWSQLPVFHADSGVCERGTP
jgi:hypothetical protein